MQLLGLITSYWYSC